MSILFSKTGFLSCSKLHTVIVRSVFIMKDIKTTYLHHKRIDVFLNYSRNTQLTPSKVDYFLQYNSRKTAF